MRERLTGRVEYAVEDAPEIPDNWAGDPVPLSAVIPARSGQPARVVLFRRPIEHRCETRGDLEMVLHTVLVERLAELLGLLPQDLDPDYEA